MNFGDVAMIKDLASIAGPLATSVTAGLLFFQIRRNQQWNRTKATQEVIDKIIYGEFPRWSEMLQRKYGCKFSDRTQAYMDVFNSLQNENDKRELNFVLKRIFNVIEVAGIHIEKGTVDENICYHTFSPVLLMYFRWGEKFLEQKRNGNQEIFKHIFKYAEKWKKQEKEGRRESKGYKRKIQAKITNLRGKLVAC
jgi:hypothetical protein